MKTADYAAARSTEDYQQKETVERMRAFTRDQDFELAGPHHEIYISEPNRTQPEKLKTVIHYPIKRRPQALS